MKTIRTETTVPDNSCKGCKFGELQVQDSFNNKHYCKLFDTTRTFPRWKYSSIPPCAECRASKVLDPVEFSGTAHDYLYRTQFKDAEARLAAAAAQGMYGGLSSLGRVHDSLYFKTAIDPLVRETRMATAEMKADRLGKELQAAKDYIDTLLQKNAEQYKTNEEVRAERAEVYTRYETVKAENLRMSKIVDRLMDRLFKLRKIIEEA